jgi:hypothetical protein
MEEGPRFFTVEEANELVGTLQMEFGRVAQLRTEIAPVIEAVGGADAAVAILQEGVTPAAGKEELAERLRRLAADITATLERITAHGCLVKDLEMGLVDFYAVLGGETVLLCWQFGEPAVTYYHEVGEGYAGRRPIEGVTLEPPTFLN